MFTPQTIKCMGIDLYRYRRLFMPINICWNKTLHTVSVTISRQAGSGGAAIATSVGARLGWPVYDNQLLAQVAKEQGVNVHLLEHLDERCTSWLKEVIAGFSTQVSPTEGKYMKELVKLLVSLGQIGHCVIVGRGAGYVLPRETTVRVRVVAPRAVRVANIERQKNLSRAEAEHWVDQTDADRLRFVKSHFYQDPFDPLNYDLILNSGRYSADDCVQLIVQATRMREAHVRTALAASA